MRILIDSLSGFFDEFGISHIRLSGYIIKNIKIDMRIEDIEYSKSYIIRYNNFLVVIQIKIQEVLQELNCSFLVCLE